MKNDCEQETRNDHQGIERWKVGDRVSIKRIATNDTILQCAQLSGDYNAIHIDEEYATRSFFHKRIAHGLFCLSMISYLVGMELPGEGAIFINESINYKAPVFLNDEIEASVEITEIDYKKSKMLLRLLCKNQNKTICLEGTTLVKVLA